MKRTILVASVILFIVTMAAGCAGRVYEAKENRSNLYKLQIGQTKNDVLTLMGQPSKTEAYTMQGKPVEFWFYLTEMSQFRGYVPKSSDYTPLAFQDSVLKGWGRNYYDQVLRVQQDITIEHR